MSRYCIRIGQKGPAAEPTLVVRHRARDRPGIDLRAFNRSHLPLTVERLPFSQTWRTNAAASQY
jgi:hypothetical protein